jgi:hypothetical protein
MPVPNSESLDTTNQCEAASGCRANPESPNPRTPESRTPNPPPPAPGPLSPAPLPRWLKRNVPKGDAGHFTSKLIGRLGLHTVCDHAKCPNRMECYSCKTATFMILGDICTRGCRFCGVAKGRPLPPDEDEPRRVAEAVAALGLRHVVITCVARDDLADGGAEQFVRTIAAIRALGTRGGGRGKALSLPSPACGRGAGGEIGRAHV